MTGPNMFVQASKVKAQLDYEQRRDAKAAVKAAKAEAKRLAAALAKLEAEAAAASAVAAELEAELADEVPLCLCAQLPSGSVYPCGRCMTCSNEQEEEDFYDNQKQSP